MDIAYPVDPFYLTWKAKQYDFNTRFIELAGEINSGMPQHVVDRLTEGLNLMGQALNGAKVLLIGAAYKRNVEDVRESPAIRIIQLLQERLAQVSYYDPFKGSRAVQTRFRASVTALADTGSLTQVEIGEHAIDHLVVLPEVIVIPAAIGREDVAARTDIPSEPC